MQAGSGESHLVHLQPQDVLYTQADISESFSQGPPAGGSYAAAAGPRLIRDLVEQLRQGATSVADIPPIRVVWYGGKHHSLDNRRLWVRTGLTAFANEASQQYRIVLLAHALVTCVAVLACNVLSMYPILAAR